MPNEYKKRTDRKYSQDDAKAAISDVMKGCLSIRKAALKYNLKKSRLADLVKQVRENGLTNVKLVPNFKNKLVITEEMEQQLIQYVLRCSKMFYGLSPNAIRRLAWEYGVANHLNVPHSWQEKNMAGKCWFTAFMKRHPNISIRTPEATSLARMTAFNKHTVGGFFQKLQEVVSRYNFQGHHLYNLDETGISTVPEMDRVVAEKGIKQVGQVTSRERGESITQASIICANGQALPPILIFPRVKFDKRRMMAGAAPGALGLAHKTGYMTSEKFLDVLVFFKDNVRCSKENRVLLIMDNHESHLSIEAINFARENGIVFLTLPPHTSNKLQPLDVSVFGPFKRFVSAEVNAWMLTNPNETIDIYALPKICATAWDRAATPENVKSGFRASGIFPFDSDIFSEDEYLSSAVSDRPEPESTSPNLEASSSRLEDSSVPSAGPDELNNNIERGAMQDDVDELSSNTPKNTKLCLPSTFISPEDIRPFPKAKPRKASHSGRRKGRCMVATDTPEKEEIEMRKLKKNKPAQARVAVRRKLYEMSSSSEEETEFSTPDDDEEEIDWEAEALGGDSSIENNDEPHAPVTGEDVDIGDWVVINYSGVSYPGQIKEKDEEGVKVSCLEKGLKYFKWPAKEDVMAYSWDQVQRKIDPPRQLRRGFFDVPELSYYV